MSSLERQDDALKAAGDLLLGLVERIRPVQGDASDASNAADARIVAEAERLHAAPDVPDVPDVPHAHNGLDVRIMAEAERLRAAPEEARALAAALVERLGQPRQAALFAEAGVRSALGLLLETAQRLGRRVLPLPPDERRLDDLLSRAFHSPDDVRWLEGSSVEAWHSLAQALGLLEPGDALAEQVTQRLDGHLVASTLMLSVRLAGLALDRELLRLAPEIEDADSPFLRQALLLTGAREPTSGTVCLGAAPVPEVLALLVRAEAYVEVIRVRAAEAGISIRLSYQLSRMAQLSGRLRLLLPIVAGGTARAPGEALVGLLRELVRALARARGVGAFVAEDLSLIARNMTEHASRHGEHYIARGRRELWALALSAAGGGALIALMALIKLRVALLHLPPLPEATIYGLIYGLGFVVIHLVGCSVATKQPAMTAASIAARLESPTSEGAGVRGLLRDVFRSQAVAVAGNMLVAFPVACLLAWAWSRGFGLPPAPDAKVAQLVGEVDPFASAALLYAAVAGVGLFLSGLVSGFFDNHCRYARIADRIAATRSAALARFVDAHYGAVIGNLFFGFYLGYLGEMPRLTGLPVDVRHVAFSTANLGTATAIGDRGVLDGLPRALVGVLGIGAINLLVSFALALFVALLARGVGLERAIGVLAHPWRAVRGRW